MTAAHSSQEAGTPASTVDLVGHPDLERAFRACDLARVRWVVLRGSTAGERGDLDLVVHPDDRAAVANALVSAGFVLRRAPEHRPHRLFVRRSSTGDSWLVIDVLHVVEPMGRRRRSLDIAAALVARSERDTGGIPRLAVEDAWWLALLRSRGVLVPAGPRPVGVDSPVARGLDIALGTGTAQSVLTATAGEGVSAALADVERGLTARGVGTSIALRRWRDAASWGAEGRRGVSLAVLGPDGAGKSTLVEGLLDVLPLAVSVHYLGVFRTSEKERALRRIPGVALIGKLLKLRARSLIGAVDVRRGRVVLYDRHVVDALLRPGRRTTRSAISYGLLARSCPPPDLFVVLDAPGEVMFARKGEHDAQVLEERRQRYLELRDRYPAVAVVDATRSADQVRAAVEDLVWQLYGEPDR